MGLGNSRRDRKKLWNQIYRNRWLYLMMVLPVAYFIIFKFGPIYGLQISFRDFRVRRGIWGSEWVGLKHFRQYLTNPGFWILVKNTILLGIGQVLFVFPIPIIFALLVNEVRSKKGQRLIQNISYLPHFVSVVVVASMVTTFLAKDGIINKIIAMLGGSGHLFMQDPKWFRPVYWISNLWQEMGWSAIIYIAAITAIDPNLYEAARVDGAKKLQEIWHITLPGIRSTILTLFILEIGKLLSSNFDQIFNLYSPAVYDVADVLDTYTYRQGLESFNFSYATAAGFFQNGIGFVLVIISNIVVKHLSSGEESLW